MLNDNKDRTYRFTRLSMHRHFTIAPNTTIYNGALVAIDENGLLYNANSKLKFVGIAMSKYTNTKNVIDNDNYGIIECNLVEKIPYKGANYKMIGEKVFAVSDDEVTFESEGFSHNCIGTVFEIDKDEAIWVMIRY